LPAGNYVFIAKAIIDQTSPTDTASGAGSAGFVACTLTASGNSDTAEAPIGRNKDDPEVDRATFNTEVTATLPASSAVTFACQRNGTVTRTLVARQIKIIAIKVNSVTRTSVSG
jgi:hypothetical protein